jgi:arylsulfatase A-like enzyme
MTRRELLKLAGMAAVRGAADGPNIVFILADDIGYGDLGCYGATRVATPHVDRLAKEGVRFTDAHAAASVCTPTRYSFLTGQYAWRNPAGDHILSGEDPLAIGAGVTTVPSLLKRAGYATGLVGKWHLGLGAGEIDWNGDVQPGPLEVGVDYAYYFPATNDRVPCVFVENHRVAGLDPRDPIRVSYREKVGTDPTGREHPEMLKLKLLAGHDGTIVNGISRIGFMSGGQAARWTDETIADTLVAKAVSFIERSRSRQFFLYLATHDIHQPRWPHNRHRGTSGCGMRCDAIREFDASVGAVLAALDRLRLAGNTLLIVSSDNGGMMDDGYASGDVRDANGHTCNGPLRGFKGDLWEGGHREPFVARWSGKIRPGTRSDELICLTDMLATCAAITGQHLADAEGPDSFNILPALRGEKRSAPVREHLVMQAGSARRLAIRQGRWKLIPAPAAGGEHQLYDLEADLAEQNNLAAQHPERVKELSDLLARLRSQGRSRG